MSADNGIYILHTKEGQYRTRHLQAIDNLYWEDGDYTKEPVSSVVFEMFDGSYTKNKDIARNIAFGIAKNLPVCEYGIREIYIHKTWKKICAEAGRNEVVGGD